MAENTKIQTVKLQDFVHAALIEISEGVRRAQKDAEKFGVVLNPPHLSGKDTRKQNEADWIEIGGNQFIPVQSIKFDIAATALGATEGNVKAGVGVLSAVLHFGAEGRLKDENTTVTRLQFDVRIALPAGE